MQALFRLWRHSNSDRYEGSYQACVLFIFSRTCSIKTLSGWLSAAKYVICKRENRWTSSKVIQCLVAFWFSNHLSGRTVGVEVSGNNMPTCRHALIRSIAHFEYLLDQSAWLVGRWVRPPSSYFQAPSHHFLHLHQTNMFYSILFFTLDGLTAKLTSRINLFITQTNYIYLHNYKGYMYNFTLKIKLRHMELLLCLFTWIWVREKNLQKSQVKYCFEWKPPVKHINRSSVHVGISKVISEE